VSSPFQRTDPFRLIPDRGWSAFGTANGVLLRWKDKQVIIRGHGGEIVPGFILEDLLPTISNYLKTGRFIPVTAEIDPTIKHLSVVCAARTRGHGTVLARARRINACWTNPILARRPVQGRPSL
jgi:hypothetical protein